MPPTRHLPKLAGTRYPGRMILRSNLPRLTETALNYGRVLDIGGWHNPFCPATHVLDLGPYASRQSDHSLTPGLPERFTDHTWLQRDACESGWPYTDNFFDFAICNHLLEDVRDPLTVCREMSRVARRGYVEVPSRAREIFCKSWFVHMKAALGAMPEIGFYHHRWFVERDQAGALIFIRRTHQAVMSRDFYITRTELRGKLTEQESALAVWWEGRLSAAERFDLTDQDLRRFKHETLRNMRRPRRNFLRFARG